MSRLQAAGAAALLLLTIGVFAARCVTNPAIPFLVQDAEAPWIMFPIAPTGLMGLAPRDALPVTTFRRSFELPASGVPRAELRVRAMRASRLWLNGAPIRPPGPPPGHWRAYRSLDVSGDLRPGANELRVEVVNPTGPIEAGGISSNPTIEISAGTSMPNWCRHCQAPKAIRSLAATMAEMSGRILRKCCTAI